MDKQFDITMIEGLEDYIPEQAAMTYIKIINAETATTTGLQAGTVVAGQDEVLASVGKDFTFIPIKYYKDWTIWEDRNFVKRTFSKTGVWSDGSPIIGTEFIWEGKTPPIATESLNFIVLPVSELEKDEPRFMCLNFSFTNAHCKAVATKLLNLIINHCVKEKVNKIHQLAFSIKTGQAKNNKGNIWMDFSEPKFVKVVMSDLLEITQPMYDEVKDINKPQQALLTTTAEIVQQIPENAVAAEAVEPIPKKVETNKDAPVTESVGVKIVTPTPTQVPPAQVNTNARF